MDCKNFRTFYIDVIYSVSQGIMYLIFTNEINVMEYFKPDE